MLIRHEEKRVQKKKNVIREQTPMCELCPPSKRMPCLNVQQERTTV